MSLLQKGRVSNKVNLQSVAIFQYYLHQLFPNSLKGYQVCVKQPLHLHSQQRGISYHYICDCVELNKEVSPDTALNAAKNIYFKDFTFRIDQLRGKKELKVGLSMVPLQKNVKDQLDILLHNIPQKRDLMSQSISGLSRQVFKSSHSHQFQMSSKQHSSEVNKSPKNELFQLYIIHYSQQQEQGKNLSWLSFIERFNFVNRSNSEVETKPYMVYQAVMTNQVEDSILPIHFEEMLLRQYFQRNCKINKKGNVQLLEEMNHEFQIINTKELREEQRQIQKVSFDPIHRRSLSLPSQYRHQFLQLNAKTTSHFINLNPKRQPCPFFIQNLVCRMMQRNKFKDNQSWQAIQYYLQFEKRMRQQYTWDSFKDLRQMNSLNYIGKDKMGRPIAFHTVKNVNFEMVKDFEKYFDFNFYFFQIFLKDQSLGWVDQFVTIIDSDQQKNQNINLGFSKRLTFQAYKLTFGRVKHIWGCNIGSLGQIMAKLLLAILPKQMADSVSLFGQKENDLEQFLFSLRQQVPDEMIPDFLGGSNRNVYEIVDRSSQRDKKDHSFDCSSFPFQ